MERNNGNVPLLGQKPTHTGAQFVALARCIDDNGLVPLENGLLSRSAFLDAQELAELIRAVLREELKAMLNKEPSS